MTGFDIAVFLLVALGAVTGFMRGFVEEVLSLAAWVLSLIAIHYLHGPMAAFLEPRIGTPSGASILAFAILLLIPYAAMKVIAGFAGRTTRASVLGPIDRLLGFGFGSIKGVIIAVLAFSVLVLGYDTVWGPGGRPTWITQSRSYPFIDAASDALVVQIGERRAAAEAAASADLKGSSRSRSAR
jgi:membrane protein required for colicin V production